MVRFALDSYPQLQLTTQIPHIGDKALMWKAKEGIGLPLTQEESEICQRFGLESQNSIGFFIAKFTKCAPIP